MNNTDILVPTEESEVAELEAPAEVVEPGLEPGGDGGQQQQVALQPPLVPVVESPQLAPEEVGETPGVQEELVPRAVESQPVPEEAKIKHPSLYFNQELSWIDFNWRVLYLALDERTPLLERVRFVAITASNLDEFIQKRVGGLKRQEAAGVRKLSPDGRMPTEQLALIHSAALQMHRTMTETWENELKPALKEQAGVSICNYDELTAEQRDELHIYFQTQIYPILTPLTVDPGHPFPFISNLSLSLAIILRHPYRDTLHFARLKVPKSLGRWLPLNDDSYDDDLAKELRFLPIEQLIAQHVDELIPGHGGGERASLPHHPQCRLAPGRGGGRGSVSLDLRGIARAPLCPSSRLEVAQEDARL